MSLLPVAERVDGELWDPEEVLPGEVALPRLVQAVVPQYQVSSVTGIIRLRRKENFYSSGFLRMIFAHFIEIFAVSEMQIVFS